MRNNCRNNNEETRGQRRGRGKCHKGQARNHHACNGGGASRSCGNNKERGQNCKKDHRLKDECSRGNSRGNCRRGVEVID